MTAEIFSFINIKSAWKRVDSYPRLQNLAYPAPVLSNEGALSRGDPSADRARAGRTGAPRNGRWPGGRWSAGRRCALPWARAVPCRARWAHHMPQGCPLVPWRLPPLHRLARFARNWQTSDALRRENAEPCPVIPGRSRSERTRNPEVKLG